MVFLNSYQRPTRKVPHRTDEKDGTYGEQQLFHTSVSYLGHKSISMEYQ